MERKYEILTGSLEKEFWRLVESRERKREEERERKEKMGAASSKVAASASQPLTAGLRRANANTTLGR